MHQHRNDTSPIHRLSLIQTQVYSGMPRDEDEIVFEDPLPLSRLRFVVESDSDPALDGCTIDQSTACWFCLIPEQ